MKFKDEYWTPRSRIKAVLVALAMYILMGGLSGCVKPCDYPTYEYHEWKDGKVIKYDRHVTEFVRDSASINHYLMLHYNPDADSSRLDFIGIRPYECLTK